MGFSRVKRWAVLILLAAAVVIAAGYMVSMRERDDGDKGTLVQDTGEMPVFFCSAGSSFRQSGGYTKSGPAGAEEPAGQEPLSSERTAGAAP